MGSARDNAAGARIAAELRAFGYAPQVRVMEGAPDPTEAERALRAGARAVVQLDGRAGRTQVSIADPAGRPGSSPAVLEGTPGTIDPILVVRTVELVRAALLRPSFVVTAPAPAGPAASAPPAAAPPPPPETPTAPVPPAAAPPATPPTAPAAPPAASPSRPPAGPPVVALSPPRAPPESAVTAVAPEAARPVPPDLRRWRTGLSAGVAAATGGLAPELIVQAQLSVRLTGPLHADVFAIAPLTDSPTTTGAGSSRSTAWLAGAGATARTQAARVSLEAGAGGAAIWLRSTGAPAPSSAPLTGGSDSAAGAVAYGRLGAALPLGRSLSARLDLFAGQAVRRPVVRFGDVDTAAWGPAFAIATAGLDLRW